MSRHIGLPLRLQPGWQTIVFLLRANDGSGSLRRAVHLARLHRPWRAADPGNVAAEVALAALERGHAVFGDDVVDDWLADGEDLNRVVGILAAHALLPRTDDTARTYDAIVDRLRKIIPGYPDVLALSVVRDGGLASRRTRACGHRCSSPPIGTCWWRPMFVGPDFLLTDR